MGVSIHYWAIPPSSALFERLRRDKAFVTLTAALFPYGCGIFYFFEEFDAAEREEVLAGVIDHYQNKLGGERETRRLIEDFASEIKRTRLAYPGVERRSWSLEKTSFLVEERLLEALKGARKDAKEFVGRLLHGDEQIGRDDGLYLDDPSTDMEAALKDLEDTLGLISPSLVREGAQVLGEVDAISAFINDRVYEYDSFQRWRELYRDAATQGDALLVGVC